MDNELKLYHGSPNEFNQFDAAFISMSLYGWGFNFTTDLGAAMDFGDKIYTIEVPDDAKFLDFENNDIFGELANKVLEDLETHGISRDYVDIEFIRNDFKTFKEQFWYLQKIYSDLTGVSRNDSMKMLSNIIKSFGYIGTKYKYIYVIFDRNSFKIKDIKRIKESVDFGNISKKILNETLSRLVYHFTDLSKLHKMIATDTIKFSKGLVKDMKLGIRYGRNMPYFLSTTRVRDARFGYSTASDVRIELNSDNFNSNFHSSPINFFKGIGGKSWKNAYTNKDEVHNEYLRKCQPFVENEDRIFSNKSELHNIDRYITRIDILLPPMDLVEYFRIYPEVYRMIRDIYNSQLGLKTFIYNNKSQFNIQGKNVTEEVLKLI